MKRGTIKSGKLLTPIPKKITHDHIIDSVVEVRFIPKNERTTFLDMLTRIKEYIPNYSFIPAEIPKQFRQADPQFQYAVEATLAGDEFSVGIGFKSLVFNCQNGYKTWSEFSPFIFSVLESLSPEIERVTRVGVRFTNFFEGINDLKSFNVAFIAGQKGLREVTGSDVSQLVLKYSTAPRDGVAYIVTVANFATVPKRSLPGVLVDVDAYVDKDVPEKVGKELFKCIEKTHLMEKQMFFSLLENSFLRSLQPTY